MSADNTIVVLETKGEFRVGHFQAVGSLYWSFNNPDDTDIVSARVFEYFHTIKPVKGRDYKEMCSNALLEAKRLLEEYGYVEYGIQCITIDKTFLEVANKASEEIKKEIEFVLSDMNNENRIEIATELYSTLNEIHGWLAIHG